MRPILDECKIASARIAAFHRRLPPCGGTSVCDVHLVRMSTGSDELSMKGAYSGVTSIALISA
jgi:hypothetical protein